MFLITAASGGIWSKKQMKLVWTVKEACAYTGISRTTLFKLFSEKRINRRKLGRRSYVVPEELEALFGLSRSNIGGSDA
jgi:excisionase family DNA binding protein